MLEIIRLLLFQMAVILRCQPHQTLLVLFFIFWQIISFSNLPMHFELTPDLVSSTLLTFNWFNLIILLLIAFYQLLFLNGLVLFLLCIYISGILLLVFIEIILQISHRSQTSSKVLSEFFLIWGEAAYRLHP